MGWLLVIGAATVGWKKYRLGQDMTLADGFWFAFISITTVGLGDMFLEHETIAFADILEFALIFLVGFVLLANLIVALVDLATQMGRQNMRDFARRLAVITPFRKT